MNLRISKIVISTAVLFALSSFGCGRAEDPSSVGTIPGAVVVPTVPLNPSCPAGQIYIGGVCRTGDIFQACSAALGQLQTMNGVTVCKTIMPLGFTFYPMDGFVPKLTAGNTTAALSTGIRVRHNDTLKFQGSGGWGAPEQCFGSKYCSYMSNSTCSTTKIDSPQGLFATDGTETFQLGTSLTKIVAHDGDLKIGFNTTTAQCASASISIQVARCEDQAGNTYVCP